MATTTNKVHTSAQGWTYDNNMTKRTEQGLFHCKAYTYEAILVTEKLYYYSEKLLRKLSNLWTNWRSLQFEIYTPASISLIYIKILNAYIPE